MYEDVISLVTEILNVPQGVITEESEIGELPEWDSLHNVQIMARLEEKFRVKITPEMVMDLETVADIIDLLEELAG